MATGFWDASMGLPADLVAQTASSADYSLSMATDDGLSALSISTSVSGGVYCALWENVEAATEISIYAEFRVAGWVLGRTVAFHIKTVPTGSQFIRLVSAASGSTQIDTASLYHRYSACDATGASVASINTYVPAAFERQKILGKVENFYDLFGKRWRSTEDEPGSFITGSFVNTRYQGVGKPGVAAILESTQILYLFAFGWGTDGDPAPTGPVGGISAEPFLLRHNPRLNKVIPTLSSPTVTDIGAACVRPRVTKGY